MNIFLILLLVSSSLMASTQWQSNIDHSEVLFQVPYMSVSELTGRFKSVTARAQIGEKVMPEKIDIDIAADSIDTSHKLRDGHLKSNDFLSTTVYPQITFRSQEIKKSGPKKFIVTGLMTIKNVTRKAQVEFEMTDIMKDTWGYENVFVKFKSSLNRKDYRIVWNKTLEENKYLVGDVVTFWGVFQLQPFKGATPPSKHMIPDTEYIRKREKMLREKEDNSFSQKLRNLINGK